MRYLEDQAGAGAQVILTTHSPQFASSAKVERMTVIAESTASTRAAYHLGGLKVPTDDLAFLRRFLDVTKSSLLFAKGVLLVEGIAEQLVIPQIASQLDLPLSRHGIAVVNVGGLNFGPFSALFKEDGLPFRCAIISDGDPVVEADYDPDDLNLSAMAKKLQESPYDRVKAFLAKRTFEWDLAFENGGANRDVLLEALSRVRPRKAKELKNSNSGSQAWADEFLAAVAKHKGVFAQSLANYLAVEGAELPALPEYISSAVRWAVPGVTPKSESK
jgi:putative ATP-dependent endonuclease of OLD family